MFHILGFLFVIIIAILLIGLSIIGTVIRSIFGLGGRRSSGTYQTRSENQQTNSSQNKTDPETDGTPSKHKKLFSEDEGEYVDYEEIKD
ncbi:MAG: DUF4834 family protein [Bacteroides sp.]|nr:DUF4834 family protein [Bacteroides sp.]